MTNIKTQAVFLAKKAAERSSVAHFLENLRIKIAEDAGTGGAPAPQDFAGPTPAIGPQPNMAASVTPPATQIMSAPRPSSQPASDAQPMQQMKQLRPHQANTPGLSQVVGGGMGQAPNIGFNSSSTGTTT
jgi:hypothetical protein